MATLFDPNNPIFQSIIVPLALSFILVGLVRFSGGERGPARFASVAIGIAILVACYLIAGWPPFPPRSSSQKLVYLILIGLVVGVVFDFTAISSAIARWIAIAFPVLGIAWLAQNKLMSGAAVLPIAVMVVAGTVAARLQYRRQDLMAAPVVVLVMAVGLIGIAIFGSSASISQIAMAVAAALGGFLLWNWPVARLRFFQAGYFTAAVTIMLLAAQLALYSKASLWALLVLALVPLIDFVAAAINRRYFAETTMMSRAIRPVIVGVTAAVPMLAALAIAFQQSTGGSGY